MLARLLEQFCYEDFDILAGKLQEILHNHFRRMGIFNKFLITRFLSEEYDYEERQIHRRCTFGRWYYSQSKKE